MGRVLDYLLYVAFRAAEAAILALPPRASLQFANVAGAVWYGLDRRHRRRAHENIRVAFGDRLSKREQRRLAFRSFLQIARIPFESTWGRRLLGTRKQFRARMRFRGDHELLVERLRDGLPGMMITGHLGNWELSARGHQIYGAKLKVVARPIENAHLDRYAVEKRGGPDAIIPRRGALRGILHALRQGFWVGVVGDQNAGPNGEFVPFFGIPASTYGAPTWIAARASVPLYVGACVRVPGKDFVFDLHVRHIPLPRGEAITPSSVRPAVAQTQAALEEWVRLVPDQYNWMHRRWRDRPAGEVPGPHLPAYDHKRPRPQPSLATPPQAAGAAGAAARSSSSQVAGP